MICNELQVRAGRIWRVPFRNELIQKHIRHHAFLKVTPILRTYVLATHRLLYHAQTKNAYTILDCTGAKDSEINQTILKAVEYYRTVQGSLVNVIRRTGQESPALHGFPSLKFNIVMRRVTQYRLAFNQSVGHTTLQICKIIYLVMIKKISLIISKLSFHEDALDESCFVPLVYVSPLR